MKPDEGKTLGLIISERADRSYYHVEARPVMIEADGGIRNPSEHPLQDLVVSSQGNNERPDSLYAFEVGYQPHRVDLCTAQRMVKALTQIQRRFTQMTARYGAVRESEFGTFVQRVGTAIGATKMVFKRDGRSGWSYDECTWDVVDLSTGADRIQRMVAEWRETWRERLAPRPAREVS